MMVSNLLRRLSEGAKAWWDKQALQADWELEHQIRLTFPEDAADYAASSFGSSAARVLKGSALTPRFQSYSAATAVTGACSSAASRLRIWRIIRPGRSLRKLNSR